MSRIGIIFYLLLIFVFAVEAQFVNGDFSDTLDGPFDGFGWEWYENDIDTCDHGAACDLHDSLNTCTPTYTGDFVSSPMCGYVYSGATGYCGDGGLVQTVTVPSTTPVYLHFWFKHKADSWGGKAVIILDEGPIVDNDSNYYILASHRFPGGVGGGPTPWMERIINVSPWAGRTVNIRVALWDKSTHWCNMGDHSNWVWVDDFFFYSPGVLPADLFYPETLRFDPTASCEFLPFRIGARAFNYGVSGTIDSVQAHLFLPDGLALDDPLTVRQWLNPPSLYPDSSGDVFWNVHADGTVLDTTVCFEIMFVYIAGDSFIMSDTVLYESDFELDDGGLVSSDPAGWQWGVPVGPPGAHSGTKCWGTVIGGDYDGGSHNWDLTLSVDLRSLSTTDRAELIFWHWYELPITYSDTTDWSIDHVYDGGNVCASTDGGATWFNISGGGYWVDLLGSTGWGSGRLTGWQRVECDLSMLVGHTVLLRFRFANDATDNDYAGWYIDDVRVIAHKASTPIPYPDTTIVSGCIFIPPVVYADAGDDVTICYGERAIIGGSPSADKGVPPYTYIWTPAAGLNNPSSPNPIASPDTTTQYILTVIDSVNCIDEDTVVVTVKYPVVDSVWFWEETDCNDSNIVHICYTLSNCEANISVWMSADSGGTWTPAGSSWFVTLLDTAGDIGANITLGTHCFEWVMSEDLPGVEDSSFEVMVIANRVKETAETTYLAVSGKACPYFAGQPSGVSVHSIHDGIDSTPTHSPVCIPVPDCVDFFEIAATGSTLFYHGTPNIPPDSRDGPPPVPSPTVVDPADGYDDFGISTFDGAGMCALLGVFL
ncbi:hypothetical protein J7J62_05600, partial [bacterium]|nr:hypothetical protein [bacterium]